MMIMTKQKTCEFIINVEYDFSEGIVEHLCKQPALFELCIGADGDHLQYLCAEHRPSYSEL